MNTHIARIIQEVEKQGYTIVDKLPNTKCFKIAYSAIETKFGVRPKEIEFNEDMNVYITFKDNKKIVMRSHDYDYMIKLYEVLSRIKSA